MANSIGVSTAAFYPLHLTEDALEIIAGLGFRVVEIFLQAEAEYTLEFARELDRRRQDLGLQIHSLHLYSLYFDLWSPYPRLAQETRARFRQVLEVATVLEARALTWHGLRFGLDKSRLIDAFFQSAAWAGERARAAGSLLCIENVSWCYLRAPEHVAAVREANLPVGFTFDAFQAGESGVDPSTLIRAMDTRLATVHLADYAPAGPRHLPPGEGTTDWPALLEALRMAGYGGPLILEPARVDDPTVLLRARDFVRQALADLESAGE